MVATFPVSCHLSPQTFACAPCKPRTEISEAIYGARESTVEPVIGIIKEVLGFRQFSLRGLAAAAGEWCLVCLAFNWCLLVDSKAIRVFSPTNC